MVNVSAKFCRCHVFCVCLDDFSFNADEQNNNNNNNNSNENENDNNDNEQRQFINLTCDFRFIFSASYFKSGLGRDNAHGGMRQ